MDISSVFLIALGLAMDAFAVSVASGVAIKTGKLRHAFRLALFFGGFQALMPFLGWLAGRGLSRFIAGFDHWVAFAILAFIGSKMIYEGFRLEPGSKALDYAATGTLLLLAVATSIDAFAAGITLAVLQGSILMPIIIVGLVTFVLSLVGVFIGDRVGHFFESKIEVAGGVVLILIGIKILVEHLS